MKPRSAVAASLMWTRVDRAPFGRSVIVGRMLIGGSGKAAVTLPATFTSGSSSSSSSSRCRAQTATVCQRPGRQQIATQFTEWHRRGRRATKPGNRGRGTSTSRRSDTVVDWRTWDDAATAAAAATDADAGPISIFAVVIHADKLAYD